MSASCVYEGAVRHRRHEPVHHELRYPLAMLYLDLGELPARALLRGADHLGDDAARDLVEARTGTRPDGPVRLLTIPRGFNPVSFYYCFGDGGLRAVVAEVTNTPWGERHAYVLEGARGELDKAFHVSPFLGMDHRYAWRVTEPGERLAVHIAADGAFDASLTLRRRELDRRSLRRVLWQAPAVPRIYRQALRLKLKGAPYHPHPARGPTGSSGRSCAT